MTDTTITMIGNIFAALSLFVFGVLVLREGLRSHGADEVRQ
jgi:Na+/phosphate symporter